MPAKSQAQRRAAAMALAAKKGKISPRQLRGSARSMYNSMSARQLTDFARTPGKLPRKVAKTPKRRSR